MQSPWGDRVCYLRRVPWSGALRRRHPDSPSPRDDVRTSWFHVAALADRSRGSRPRMSGRWNTYSNTPFHACVQLAALGAPHPLLSLSPPLFFKKYTCSSSTLCRAPVSRAPFSLIASCAGWGFSEPCPSGCGRRAVGVAFVLGGLGWVMMGRSS